MEAGTLREPGERGPRAAIVAGLRTPFARQATAYRDLSALDLAQRVVVELLNRSELDPAEVDQLVFGQVIPSVRAPNIAREVVLGTGLPEEIEAYSVSQACITSYRSVIEIAKAIEAGSIEVGVAGGAESASIVPVPISRNLQKALLQAGQAKSLGGKIGAFSGVRPSDLIPREPAIAEPSTGETMGEGAERMAKMNDIPREDQDEFAHRSHTLAIEAWEQGKFDDEVMPVHLPPDYEETIAQDNTVRPDSNLEKLAKLPPVFDREHGTVTAGNSSPLTDGAAAILLMSEEKAKSEGYPILGYIRSFAFTALDPSWQLLLGPAMAGPFALDQAGMELDDMDLYDQHEAFSAQILSVIQKMESDEFAREHLDRNRAVGEIDWEIFNVNGGSIALGHPFAATGARQITQTLNELQRRGEQLALCGACAAGGMAATFVLEAAE